MSFLFGIVYDIHIHLGRMLSSSVCVCMDVYVCMCAHVLAEAKESNPSEAVVSAMWVPGIELGPLEWQSMLLTAEVSLQPLLSQLLTSL